MGAVKELGMEIARELGKPVDHPDVITEFNRRLGKPDRDGKTPLMLMVERTLGLGIDQLLSDFTDHELAQITGIEQSTIWRWRKQREAKA